LEEEIWEEEMAETKLKIRVCFVGRIFGNYKVKERMRIMDINEEIDKLEKEQTRIVKRGWKRKCSCIAPIISKGTCVKCLGEK
jgi:hypothetical protein